MTHPERSLVSSVSIRETLLSVVALTLVAASGCSAALGYDGHSAADAGTDGDAGDARVADADAPDAQAPTSLRGTRAPEGATFRTVEIVTVDLAGLVPAGTAEAPYVKVSLDPVGSQGIFLGRVHTGTTPALNFSVPLGTTTLYYEVYDTSGEVSRGTITVGGAA